MALQQMDRPAARAAEVARLRMRISHMRGGGPEPVTLSVPEPLAPLFPDGGLRPGGVYALDRSASLLFALLAEPSRAGAWCAVVGLPDLGAEAARHSGVRLDRLLLVPSPGDRWLAVTAALTEVFPLVAVHPSSRPGEAEAARLAARLRDRKGSLIVHGSWPHAEVTLSIRDAEWSGLGSGHGLLESRAVTVTAVGRRLPVGRSVRVRLPTAGGAVARAEEGDLRFERPRLRAVAG